MENVSRTPGTLNACQLCKFVFYEIYNPAPEKLQNKKVLKFNLCQSYSKLFRPEYVTYKAFQLHKRYGN